MIQYRNVMQSNQKTNLIDVTGLTKYKQLYDAYLAGELAKKANTTHTHAATEIIEDDTHKFFTLLERTKLSGIAENANNYVHPEKHDASVITETSEKKFVSDTQISRWNDTYTKSEVDNKMATVTSGLTWRGSFQTIEELNQVEDPQDGWFAIVVNDPSTEMKNILFVYESAEPAGWKKLGEILAPGIVTEDTDGLMSAAMYKEHKKYGSDISSLQGTVEDFKTGVGLPVSSSEKAGLVKIGANVNVAEDGTISVAAPYVHPSKHQPNEIAETSEKNFVSDTQINTWTNDTYRKSEVYTKGEADSAINSAVTQATVVASDEEIASLFA